MDPPMINVIKRKHQSDREHLSHDPSAPAADSFVTPHLTTATAMTTTSPSRFVGRSGHKTSKRGTSSRGKRMSSALIDSEFSTENCRNPSQDHEDQSSSALLPKSSSDCVLHYPHRALNGVLSTPNNTYTPKVYSSFCVSVLGRILLIAAILNLLLAQISDCDTLVPSIANSHLAVGMGQEDIYFEIVEPESLRYTFLARYARDFGVRFLAPEHHQSQKGISLVLAEPRDGCSDSMVNRHEVVGNVVLAERGRCSFLQKCIYLERAAAAAVLIYDNDFENDDAFVDMIDDSTKRNCSIPAGFLLGKDGHMIRRSLTALGLNRALINIPVNMTHVPTHKQHSPPWVVY